MLNACSSIRRAVRPVGPTFRWGRWINRYTDRGSIHTGCRKGEAAAGLEVAVGLVEELDKVAAEQGGGGVKPLTGIMH